MMPLKFDLTLILRGQAFGLAQGAQSSDFAFICFNQPDGVPLGFCQARMQESTAQPVVQGICRHLQAGGKFRHGPFVRIVSLDPIRWARIGSDRHTLMMQQVAHHGVGEGIPSLRRVPALGIEQCRDGWSLMTGAVQIPDPVQQSRIPAQLIAALNGATELMLGLDTAG
jgi:hypothetical protein